jgi:hypothetical protein
MCSTFRYFLPDNSAPGAKKGKKKGPPGKKSAAAPVCLMSAFCFLLCTSCCCLLPAACRLLPAVFCLLPAVCRLVSAICLCPVCNQLVNILSCDVCRLFSAVCSLSWYQEGQGQTTTQKLQLVHNRSFVFRLSNTFEKPKIRKAFMSNKSY